jgi:hypothetical protein
MTKVQWAIIGVAGFISLLLTTGVAIFFAIQIWGNPLVDETEQACRRMVEARLHAPSTAEWVSVERAPYAYIFEVDSQNAFGTPMRGVFHCQINEDGDITRVVTREELFERMNDGLE